MSATVTYKGETLTSVSNTTKTLNTAGTYVEDDFTITDSSVDVSGVTATAADVASGKYFVDSAGVLTEGTASGGVENVVIEYHDDFGSVAKIWVAPNATVEDVVDIELGTSYKKITTPKQSLFVVGSIGMAPSPQSDIPCETVDNGSRASIRYWTAYFVGNSGAIIYY